MSLLLFERREVKSAVGWQPVRCVDANTVGNCSQRCEPQRLLPRASVANWRLPLLPANCRDKTAAHSELSSQHRALQEDSQSLAAENAQLQSALAAAEQRAQQAETLGTGLQAECAAARQLQAALQEEATGLKAELQQASVLRTMLGMRRCNYGAHREIDGNRSTKPVRQPVNAALLTPLHAHSPLQEREQAHRLQAALAEEQAAGMRQRAALQGRQDELASLLGKLDEYSSRIVHVEGGLDAARAASQQAATGQAAAEAAAAAARHENACLHDSLAELADAEARWKQQLEEAQEGLAAAGLEVEAARWKARQQDKAAAASREHINLLQATVQEQAGQLEAAAGLQQQVERQQRQVAGLTADLQAAAARQAAVQAEADALSAGKQEVERSLAKQTMLARRLQEQSADLAAQLAAAKKEAAAATAQAEGTAAEAAGQREEHAAAMAAQEAAHEQRRVRWVVAR